MRIALLSTLERDAVFDGPRPAFASFAGTTVIDRQLDLAVRMNCDRVICLVDAVTHEVVSLQGRAESAAVKFRAIRKPSRLAGMIDPEDEVLVLAPGLLPDDTTAIEVLDHPAIPAFPADLAVPLGYERIDAVFAWSGIMLASGELVHDLCELPEDIDVPSALLRLALQNGLPPVPLHQDLLTEGEWQLAPDRNALDLREKRWIDSQREQISFRAPGLAVAERTGARLARDLVGKPAQIIPLLAASGAILAALASALFGYPAYGLILATLAALSIHLAKVVQRISAQSTPLSRTNSVSQALDHIVDPLFILLLGLAAPETLEWLRFFAPMMLFGLLRLGEMHTNDRWRDTYADRIALGFFLSLAAFFGVATELSAIGAVLILMTRFIGTFRAS